MLFQDVVSHGHLLIMSRFIQIFSKAINFKAWKFEKQKISMLIIVILQSLWMALWQVFHRRQNLAWSFEKAGLDHLLPTLSGIGSLRELWTMFKILAVICTFSKILFFQRVYTPSKIFLKLIVLVISFDGVCIFCLDFACLNRHQMQKFSCRTQFLF